MSGMRKGAKNLDLSFFKGFAWPVPTAFSGAVAAFRFEPGDVLYRDISSYSKPLRQPQKGALAIQVLERPVRSEGVLDSAEKDPRRSNWESRVGISVLDLASGTSEKRELAQGELFMALWRGDETLLAGQGPREAPRELPALPLGARELGQSLESARDALLVRAGQGGKAQKGSRFLFVVDQSSDASRAKALTIEEGLLGLGEVEGLDLTPVEAGVAQGENYHPALSIRCLTLAGHDTKAVTAVLRKRLYGGGAKEPGHSEGEDSASDRFSVARHGLLEALEGDVPASD